MEKTSIEQKVSRQAIINEHTRKFTFEIFEKIQTMVREFWESKTDAKDASVQIADMLGLYPKKDWKLALKMVFEDDMAVFKDEKRKFRNYAQEVLEDARKIAKKRSKAGAKAIDGMVERYERFAEAQNSPNVPHPMGSGMERVRNEFRFRPGFLAQDLKFKVFRGLGIY